MRMCVSVVYICVYLYLRLDFQELMLGKDLKVGDLFERESQKALVK